MNQGLVDTFVNLHFQKWEVNANLGVLILNDSRKLIIAVEDIVSLGVHLIFCRIFWFLKQDDAFVLLIKDVQDLLLLLGIILTPKEKSLFVQCLHILAQDVWSKYGHRKYKFSYEFAIVITFNAKCCFNPKLLLLVQSSDKNVYWDCNKHHNEKI